MSGPSDQNTTNVTTGAPYRTTLKLAPGGAGVTTTTLSEYWLTTTRRSRPRNRAYTLNATDFGIPLAITVIVCMILCMVVAYTKARRRRQRQEEGAVTNLRAISGGVPMNVNAYRNYGYHLQHGNRPGPGHARGHGMYPPPGRLPAPLYPEQPPSYDEAISSPPVNPNYQQLPYGGSRELLPTPPAYTVDPQGRPVVPPTAVTTAGDNVAPSDGNYQQQSSQSETPTGEPPGGHSEQRERMTDADENENTDKRKKTARSNSDDREIEQVPKPDSEGAVSSRHQANDTSRPATVGSSRADQVDANNVEADVHGSTTTTTRSSAL